MLEHVLSAPGSPAYCQLHYDEVNDWVQTVWQGFVDPALARQGAHAGLSILQQAHCPFLLNDNSRLQGPWFDSLQWLSTEWGPAAANAGLRYVAHVAQPGTSTSPFADPYQESLFIRFEIQVFDRANEATEWLRSCQHRPPIGPA